MSYSDEQINAVVLSGAFSYPIDKIINILDNIDPDEFRRDFNDPESIIFKSYRKGNDRAQFVADTAIYNAMKGGDVSAIKLYLERKEQFERIDQDEKDKCEFTREFKNLH